MLTGSHLPGNGIKSLGSKALRQYTPLVLPTAYFFALLSQMPSQVRTRLTKSQETFLVALDKKVRATHYKDVADQRDFLDKQSKIVVRFIPLYFTNPRKLNYNSLIIGRRSLRLSVNGRLAKPSLAFVWPTSLLTTPRILVSTLYIPKFVLSRPRSAGSVPLSLAALKPKQPGSVSNIVKSF